MIISVLLQLDSLHTSSERAFISDWVNILTVVISAILIVGTILFVRYYKRNQGNK